MKGGLFMLKFNIIYKGKTIINEINNDFINIENNNFRINRMQLNPNGLYSLYLENNKIKIKETFGRVLPNGLYDPLQKEGDQV
jgi:hypothetical protein